MSGERRESGMQGYTSKKITDREAIEYARLMDEEVVYVHKSSGKVRVADQDGSVQREFTIEERQNLGRYLGWVPTPNAVG